MATLEAIVSGTSLTLSDGAPYTLLNARGLSGAPVRRITEQGPNQFGDTDRGYRLQPREIELDIGFVAASNSELDDHRRTLVAQFKPLSSTVINLRYTRDDAVVRQVDCYTVDRIQIGLVKEHRPGNYHKATIRLRAPDPAFYNPTPGTISVQGSAGLAADWYLAGGAIGSAQVLMYGGTPAQGQAWSYTGTIAQTVSWTLALRMEQEVAGTATKYAFVVDNEDSGFNSDISFQVQSSGGYAVGNPIGDLLGTAFMPAGTSNFYFRHDDDYLTIGGSATTARDSVRNATTEVVPTYIPAGQSIGGTAGGTARFWRSNAAGDASSYWSGSIFSYALYSPGLTESEIDALDPFLSATVGGTAYLSKALNYLGDLPEYPIISVTGPITSPVVRSAYTNDDLAFPGVTIGAGTTYVIDTRPDRKTIYAGTVNKKGELSASSDLGDFNITPNTVQGINVFQLTGTNTGTATKMEIVYYTRYSSI